jgi:hypothetical protein
MGMTLTVAETVAALDGLQIRIYSYAPCPVMTRESYSLSPPCGAKVVKKIFIESGNSRLITYWCAYHIAHHQPGYIITEIDE